MSISITKVIERFLDSMLEKDMKKWIELWDDQAVFEFPYAPAGFPEKLKGNPQSMTILRIFQKKLILYVSLLLSFIKYLIQTRRLQSLSAREPSFNGAAVQTEVHQRH